MPTSEHYIPVISLDSEPVIGKTVSLPIPFGEIEASITNVTKHFVLISTFFDGKRIEVKRRTRVNERTI